MRLLIGFLFGLFAMSHWSTYAYAWELRAVSPIERVGAVLTGVAILIILLLFIYKRYNSSYFHGFLAAIGLFLTVDNILFHWVFQLHRITSGPEANWLEPVFIMIGAGFVYYAWKNEQPQN
ncbi:DUF2243 domain-containing protein [Fictibacillus nanhaiensis]|uniref:DUF2243 domain-containing protein n=1 Tax=Fictibacillus nanhaiensis TaxID=742169 RepID=UPI001C97839D|nr:DUF2243 domain-containing protein [Fictibacillus nanhaiensis]MBY6036406.1 DUF2243 domain-containing protein [Fictibacillus nanhaiensis]